MNYLYEQTGRGGLGRLITQDSVEESARYLDDLTLRNVCRAVIGRVANNETQVELDQFEYACMQELVRRFPESGLSHIIRLKEWDVQFKNYPELTDEVSQRENRIRFLSDWVGGDDLGLTTRFSGVSGIDKHLMQFREEELIEPGLNDWNYLYDNDN